MRSPINPLISVLEKDDNDKKGFLFLSDDQYEDMELDWADPAAVAEALVPGSGTVTTVEIHLPFSRMPPRISSRIIAAIVMRRSLKS